MQDTEWGHKTKGAHGKRHDRGHRTLKHTRCLHKTSFHHLLVKIKNMLAEERATKRDPNIKVDIICCKNQTYSKVNEYKKHKPSYNYNSN